MGARMRALLLIFIIAAAQSSSHARESTTFRSAVERYKTGQSPQAVETLILLRRSAIGESNEAFGARKRLPVDLRAAAMLHTDTAEVLWQIDRGLALAHIDRARAWADAAEEQAPDFRRRWYVASGLLLVEAGAGDGDVDPAFVHFERACRTLRDDESLLTITAWLEERLALAAVSWNRRNRPASDPGRAKQLYLRSAEERLETALTVAPSTPEAALRLGRIRILRENHEGAVRVLEPLTARTDVEPSVAYTARLFLARAMEETKNPMRAIELYRDAIELIPAAASARMGLARLLYASNDVRGASVVLQQAMSSASADDPWHGYLTTYIERAASFRRTLRKEVQQ